MIELEEFYIGINYDYTQTKFFFTAKQPYDEKEDNPSISFYIEIDEIIAERPCTLLYANGMKIGSNYVWQTLVHSDNYWKDYLKLHVGEQITVIIHQDEEIHEYHPTLYYFGDKTNKNQCTVPLPNTGWQIGAYDVEVVYPTNRHYNKSQLNTQLAYKTWNWLSRVYCEGADENGRIMMYPTESTELIFNVVDKDDKPIDTGDLEVVISEVYADTQIYGYDLTLEEGTVGDLQYTITTVSDSPELVPVGNVNINQTIQSIEVVGDVTSTDEWNSSQSIATADSEYIPASSSNNILSTGKNCVTYWQTFVLIPETTIKFTLEKTEGTEFAFGLIDVNTEHALFTIKHEKEGTYTFIQENNTTEHWLAPNLVDGSSLKFEYFQGDIILHEHGTTHTISSASTNYYFFIQGYDDLSSLKCSYIKGGYGDDL